MQSVCDRIIVINKGRVVANDTPENLYSTLSQSDKLMVRVRGPEQGVYEELVKIPGITKVAKHGQKEDDAFDFILENDGNTDIRIPVFRMLSAKDWPILTLRSSEASLEDIFLQLTTETTESED